MTVTTSNVDLIDQEITQHQNTIRELKFHRNTFAPINQLPAEILCKIFMLCITPNEHYARTYRDSLRWSWIKVSHICQYWRSVALSCPSLWSRPDFLKPAWVPQMLQRSKMALLTVVLTDNWITPKSLDSIIAALQHLDRTRELTLSMSREHFEKLLPGINQAAPYLQTLSLDASFANYRKEPGVSLPEDFMKGDTPRLSRLELKDCYLPWESSLLKNLTFLKLHHLSTTPSPSLRQLMEILNRMPALELLDLKNVLPTDSTIVPSLYVTLPRLRMIRLDGEAAGCANVLNHLSFPSTAAMQLLCGMGNRDDSLALILSSLAEICSHFSTYRVYSMSVSCTRFGVIIDMGTTPLKSGHAQPWLLLSMQWPIDKNPSRMEAVRETCRILPPLTHLRTLTLQDMPKGFGLEFLEPLHHVNSLEVTGTCTRDVLYALMACEDDRVALLPFLRCMILRDVDFEDNSSVEEGLIDVLRDCLMTRYEHKAEVRQLRLMNCLRLDMMDVRLFNEIVVDIDWDKRELGFDDTDSEFDVDTDPEFYYLGR
ncbi:hypothetical protein D9758_007815 [Tetrapyrgos nigripes]|uniref:F-box domain-containing protein n=1 Tax=Tetrapyrgos nigripes TaxID=182062 RepID=A0A8H5FVG7_9AGAR|nr:hypothetical protein D9758_007815 [Tetrapyrgos nigripes]